MKEAQFWEACKIKKRRRLVYDFLDGEPCKVRRTVMVYPDGKYFRNLDWPAQDANNFFAYVLPVLTKKDNIRLAFYKNEPVEIAPLYEWAAQLLGLEG